MNEYLCEFSLGHVGGPTVAIKDSIDVAGYATTGGSPALADAARATQHAEVVERLIEAGWHVVAKANMHELAFGMTGINDFTGTPTNPQDPSRVPGGSSSGSAAAVGRGLVDAALGTDTGGSVRGPAACCGVIGLKPTFGRLSRRGVMPAYTTLDCVGPFAREMQVLARAMAAISPDFDLAAAGAAVHGATAGIVTVEASSEILDAVTRAVSASGLASRKIELAGLSAAFEAGLTVINAETWQAFGALLATGKVGAGVDARLQAASLTSAVQVEAAEVVRRRFTHEVDAALQLVDVLVLPTLPDLPITVEAACAGASVIHMSSLIRPFNLSGHPALSLPLPLAGTHLKAGLQIVGRHGADEQVCAIGAHFESMLKLR
jgi:amidase